MKQKRLEDILYVFDVMPYEITQDTDASIIKVQEESYKGFVEMNPDLAGKIVRFNYHAMVVRVPEWAPYVDDEDPQGSLTFGIYGSAAANAINQIQVQNADNVILQSWHAGVDLEFPFQTDVEEGQHCVIECKEGTDIYQFNVTGSEYLPISWQDQETGNHWYATQPITDSISIGIENAEPSTYTFVLEGSNIHQNITVKVNDETTSYTPEQLVDGVQLNDGDVIDVYPTQNVSDYSLVSGAVWDTDHWTATVNGADVDIWINYLGEGVNFNAHWERSYPLENVNQINIGNTSVTGNDLTDPDWTETVRAYPGSSQVQYFVSTGLPTDMQKFEIMLQYQAGVDETNEEHHYAYKQTDPDTGEVFYSDAQDGSGTGVTNHGIWTYNNTPDTGLPYITFTLPATDKDGNAYPDNVDMQITALVSGS